MRGAREVAAAMRAQLAARSQSGRGKGTRAPFQAGAAAASKVPYWQKLTKRIEKSGSSYKSAEEDLETTEYLENASGLYFRGGAVAADAANAFVDGLITDGIVEPEKLLRGNFSEFMAAVQEECVKWSQKRGMDGTMKDPDTGYIDLDRGDNDPIRPIMESISTDAWILHLTNWNVASVMEAMMLRRVLKGYFNSGGFAVLTGNTPLIEFDPGIESFKEKYKTTQELLNGRVVTINV